MARKFLLICVIVMMVAWVAAPVAQRAAEFVSVRFSANGSATAPSLWWFGDSNTGLYRVGADQVAVSTGGTLRADVDTSRFSLALPLLLPAGSYANFGSTVGSSGYGVRDNGGVIECKDSGGSWTACAGGAGTPVSPALTNGVCTLASGTPYPTADQTAKTTVYYTPIEGAQIALYDGSSAWTVLSFTELSLALGTDAGDTNYDVFVYDNAGSAAVERVAWSNATTRATALTLQNGVLVKSGATTRKYVCTYRTTATGETEWSAAKRFVYNHYNAVDELLSKAETTASYNYTTATIRQAGADTTNQVAFVIGVAGPKVSVRADSIFSCATANPLVSIGIGLDATSSYASGMQGGLMSCFAVGSYLHLNASLEVAPSIGYHYLSRNEWSQAAGTVTWYGPNPAGSPGTGPTGINSGINGQILR